MRGNFTQYYEGTMRKKQKTAISARVSFSLIFLTITCPIGKTGRRRNKNMKKQDLKPGMVVEVRGGKKYLISDEGFKFIDLKSGHQFNALNGYDEGLLFRNDVLIISLFGSGENDSDIVKVYSDYTCSNLLWERKVKPSLNIDEINLLRYIQRYHDLEYDYEWLARDEDGELYVYVNKPEKSDDHWRNKHHLGDWGPIGAANPLRPFNDMFKFIKWEDEEPYSISELLKGANY